MASSTRPKPNLTSFDPYHRSLPSRSGGKRSSSLPSSAFVRSSSLSTTFLSRSSSPTCVAISGKSSSSVRSHIDHKPISPSQSLGRKISVSSKQKKTCMCSPTTHPGSFRCALHKNTPSGLGERGSQKDMIESSFESRNSSSLNFRRSVMTNSIVRIGGVEGSELVKRALSVLIRPSSDQRRRRLDFRPRPSRLSVMSKEEEDLGP